MTLRVSVVVPTFKRPDLLDRCLTALIAQEFAATDYEVIVVDDAACEKTKRQVQCWAERVELSGHTIRFIEALRCLAQFSTVSSQSLASGTVDT